MRLYLLVVGNTGRTKLQKSWEEIAPYKIVITLFLVLHVVRVACQESSEACESERYWCVEFVIVAVLVLMYVKE